MLKVHVKQVDQNGMILLGTERPEEFQLPSDELVKFNHGIDYNLNVSLVSGGILVSGKLETSMECLCGKCLKSFGKKVLYDEVCHFYDTSTKTEIDLTPELREDILMTLPQNILCDSKCKGLCPVCGGNRNLKKCRCRNEVADGTCWSELDKLFKAKERKNKK